MPHTYPFGRPVRPCPPSADGPRPLFVLGAYPSALHVRWVPPAPYAPIAAIAVDDEPTPFWAGDDQDTRVAAWKAAVGWDPAWGTATPAGRLNGSSGLPVEREILAPLAHSRGETWITDCLDTYRVSVDAAARIEDTYARFAAARGLPAAVLGGHPSEGEIVAEALRDHRARLLGELATARPDRVVTLGNAALRVLAALGEVVGEPAPRKLALDGYGRALPLRIGGRRVEWLPLAHPAAPPAYREAHRRWCDARGSLS